MDSQSRSHLPQIRFFNAHLVANFSFQGVGVAGLLLEDSSLRHARLSSTYPVSLSPQQNRTIKNSVLEPQQSELHVLHVHRTSAVAQESFNILTMIGIL